MAPASRRSCREEWPLRYTEGVIGGEGRRQCPGRNRSDTSVPLPQSVTLRTGLEATSPQKRSLSRLLEPQATYSVVHAEEHIRQFVRRAASLGPSLGILS